MSSLPPRGAQVGDPVVVDGVKYRIRSFGGAPRFQLYLKTSFGRQELVLPSTTLRWDGVAGVWRPQT